MVYHSTITFTLDTICPWTYLAKVRLSHALDKFRESHKDAPIDYTLRYAPYQLYAEASKEGEDKYDWYKNSRYNGSEDKMSKYIAVMGAYGRNEGINFKFGGKVANTLDAHRLIQHYQEEKGPEVADKIVSCKWLPSFSLPILLWLGLPLSKEKMKLTKSKALYSQYFENEAHPSSLDTLLKAATDAGISETEAKAFIEDEHEGLQEVKMLVREQAANGVDAVPHIVIEGRKRDITLTGAKEVDQYVRALEQVLKEST